MKKIIYLMLMLFVFLTCGCEEVKESVEPRYYHSFFWYNQKPNVDYIFNDAQDVSDEVYNLCSEIFYNLTRYYHLDKPMPSIKFVSSTFIEETNISYDALYYSGTIFLQKDTDIRKVKGTIAHEFCHYLADNGSREGLHIPYDVADSSYLGAYLDEGVTNFLASKLYDTSEQYPLETHVAEMLEKVVGEEALANAYFSSNPESLAEDFNNSLRKFYYTDELEPYTVFMSALDFFSTNLYSASHRSESLVSDMLSAIDTFEEMLLIYGHEKGVVEEQKIIIEKLLLSNKDFKEILVYGTNIFNSFYDY